MHIMLSKASNSQIIGTYQLNYLLNYYFYFLVETNAKYINLR